MKKILLVVDVQKGFTRHSNTIEITEKIKELLDKNYFDYVIGTKFYNDKNSIYVKAMNWNRLIEENDTDLVEGLEARLDEVVNKNIYSCINPSFIQRLSQINDGKVPEKVYILGIDTDCCVLKIGVDLFESGILPVVLANYSSSNGGLESHKAGISCLSRLVGRKQIIERDIEKIDDLDI